MESEKLNLWDGYRENDGSLPCCTCCGYTLSSSLYCDLCQDYEDFDLYEGEEEEQ